MAFGELIIGDVTITEFEPDATQGLMLVSESSKPGSRSRLVAVDVNELVWVVSV
jgi:hypothetical protein